MPIRYCRCAPLCPTCKPKILVIRYSSNTYPFCTTAGVPERQYEDMSFNRIRDMTAGHNRFGRRGRPWPREREGPISQIWEGFTGPNRLGPA